MRFAKYGALRKECTISRAAGDGRICFGPPFNGSFAASPPKPDLPQSANCRLSMAVRDKPSPQRSKPFRFGQPLLQTMPTQRLRSSLSAQDEASRGALRASAKPISPLDPASCAIRIVQRLQCKRSDALNRSKAFWLRSNKDDPRDCLTPVHAMAGMHLELRSALLGLWLMNNPLTHFLRSVPPFVQRPRVTRRCRVAC
jgi:hypothetical protein